MSELQYAHKTQEQERERKVNYKNTKKSQIIIYYHLYLSKNDNITGTNCQVQKFS